MWMKLYISVCTIVLKNLKVGRQFCRLAIQWHVLWLQTKQNKHTFKFGPLDEDSLGGGIYSHSRFILCHSNYTMTFYNQHTSTRIFGFCRQFLIRVSRPSIHQFIHPWVQLLTYSISIIDKSHFRIKQKFVWTVKK
jgi:hypothetical protein